MSRRPVLGRERGYQQARGPARVDPRLPGGRDPVTARHVLARRHAEPFLHVDRQVRLTLSASRSLASSSTRRARTSTPTPSRRSSSSTREPARTGPAGIEAFFVEVGVRDDPDGAPPPADGVLPAPEELARTIARYGVEIVAPPRRSPTSGSSPLRPVWVRVNVPRPRAAVLPRETSVVATAQLGRMPARSCGLGANWRSNRSCACVAKRQHGIGRGRRGMACLCSRSLDFCFRRLSCAGAGVRRRVAQ